jgi:hypothetical protein
MSSKYIIAMIHERQLNFKRLNNLSCITAVEVTIVRAIKKR